MSITLSRRDKIQQIFHLFDADADGALNHQELSAFIAAVNPSVNFTSSQIHSIIQEIFRSYSDFISNPNLGLSFAGLAQTYDDGAGDVDFDFANLFPLNQDQQNRIHNHNTPISEITSNKISSLSAVEDIERAIKLKIRSAKSKDFALFESFSWSADISCETKNNSSREFLKELNEIRERVDGLVSVDAVLEGHIAIGKALHDRMIFKEAVVSFERAIQLNPVHVRAHYGLANALLMLGMSKNAKDSYLKALQLAESDSVEWSDILPQIHVNLGILLEGEGLLFNACDHYREAAVLSPTHYRALKLLGSALYGVGQYGPAQKVLEEVVILNPEFADAHCDLGSVLYAMGEEERAVISFQRAIDLKSDHVAALYNLGGLFKDVGRCRRAIEMYGRVLAICPEHWRADLNRAVALLEAGEEEEAKSSMNRVFKMRGRIELYDANRCLKECRVDWVAEDVSKFGVADDKTITVDRLTDVLWIRGLQKETKLGRCKVDMLLKEVERNQLRKSEVELILRKLLHFLKADAFQHAVKYMDEKIWAVLDATSSGKIDFAMFVAIVALICEGSLEQCQLAAYNALSSANHLSRHDFAIYLKYLRLVYFPSKGFTDLMGLYEGDEEESEEISYHEFVSKIEDEEYGFGAMSTLVKLEKAGKRIKGFHRCGVCKYGISGLMFKETTAGFCLCSSCYSEGRIPCLFRRELYKFKECNSG